MSSISQETQQALAFKAGIARQAATGKYLFRGENKDRAGPVTSSLFREYQHQPVLDLMDIASIQEVEISVARQHSPDAATDPHLLHMLQHHRGKTNLIDFSMDCFIALFFACDGEPDHDGRLILLDRQAHQDHITRPTQPPNRVIAQKSVFVEPPKGYLEPTEFEQISVPQSLKIPLLSLLHASHGISGATIYNDLHGYVARRELTTQTLHIVAQASKCQEAGDYNQAFLKYAEAIRLSPENPTPYRFRAMMHYHLGNTDEAIADNTEAVRLDPGLKMAYNNRGNAYADQGQYEKALADFDQAILLDRRFAHAYNSRGAVYLEIGNVRQAARDLDLAIHHDPELAIAYCNRGLVAIQIDGPARAGGYFEKAIELAPNLAVAYYHRGLLRRELRQPDAESDLREAFRLNPGLPAPRTPLEPEEPGAVC